MEKKEVEGKFKGKKEEPDVKRKRDISMKFDPSFVYCKDDEKSSVKVHFGVRGYIIKSRGDSPNIRDHVITWKKITSDGLDLNYAPDFMPQAYVNDIFERLEKEVVYLAGDLAKVKVFGKWHNIPRQHVAYGDEGVVYKFSSLSVPAKLWISPLQEIRDYIREVLGRDYNFVLVNRYHSLPTRKTCFSTRINLTFRRVVMNREKKFLL